MDVSALDRLQVAAPFAVMLRGALDWFFDPAFLNDLAEQAFRTNYTREIHFADLVELLLPVVFGNRPSVRSAFRNNPRLAGVATLSSFYDKLAGVDPEVSRALVTRTADRARAVIAGASGLVKRPLPGYRVLTLDGNHLAATERRVEGLTAVTALPGLGVVLRDHATGLFLDLLPVPDAYQREVSHAPALLRGALRPRDCVVADREYCAAEVFDAVTGAGAFFVIRHRRSVRVHARTPLRECCKTPERTIREQRVRYAQSDREFRAVRVELATPTQAGERVVTVLTNLPAEVPAEAVAQLYRERRSIEVAFHELAMALRGEVRTVAMPKAALLCFALAAAVYNLLQVTRHALCEEHGPVAVESMSVQLLCQEVSGYLSSLLVLLAAGEVGPEGGWTAGRMRGWLRAQSRRVDPTRYAKSVGKPGSSKAKRRRSHRPHESTQRLLDSRRKRRAVAP